MLLKDLAFCSIALSLPRRAPRANAPLHRIVRFSFWRQNRTKKRGISQCNQHGRDRQHERRTSQIRTCRNVSSQRRPAIVDSHSNGGAGAPKLEQKSWRSPLVAMTPQTAKVEASRTGNSGVGICLFQSNSGNERRTQLETPCRLLTTSIEVLGRVHNWSR